MATSKDTSNFDHNYDDRCRSVDTSKLDLALFDALGEVDRVKTDGQNDFFKKQGNPHRYAGLPITVETLEPIFRKHGIMIIQGADKDTHYDDDSSVRLHLTHELRHVDSGQFRIYTLTLPLKSQDPQQLGSAITYGRRYLHQLVAGAIVEDDDANTATFGTSSKPAKGKKGGTKKEYSGKSKSTQKRESVQTEAKGKKTLAGKLGKSKDKKDRESTDNDTTTTTSSKTATKKGKGKAKRPGFPKSNKQEDDSAFDVPPTE